MPGVADRPRTHHFDRTDLARLDGLDGVELLEIRAILAGEHAGLLPADLEA